MAFPIFKLREFYSTTNSHNSLNQYNALNYILKRPYLRKNLSPTAVKVDIKLPSYILSVPSNISSS